MILLNKPYVSDFLKKTILDNKMPIYQTEDISNFYLKNDSNLLDQNSAIEKLKKDNQTKIYTNSENSINWIINNLKFTDLPKNINLFKDKVKFRKLTETIYPDFYYKEVNFQDLKNLSIDNIKKPFIVKPSVGFFSMGVYTILENDDWNKTIDLLEKELDEVKNLYPKEVLDTTTFIIEEYITGEEYAFDAYFNENGEPIIINILHHIFSSKEDVSDRVYVTSKEIIEKNLDKFQSFLIELNKITNIKNFPFHAEVRVNKNGEVKPIEINPMRFAGWCTTDVAHFAYNINPYEYYFLGKKPNWNEILKEKDNKIYSIIILDNSTNEKAENIKRFDFDKVTNLFDNVLELRKIDYNEYPIFGFLFVEIEKENYFKLENILKSNLKEYIELK